MAAPDVDDRLTVEQDGDRGADVEAVIKVARERVRHGGEPLLIAAAHISHERTLSGAEVSVRGDGPPGLTLPPATAVPQLGLDLLEASALRLGDERLHEQRGEHASTA